jgi:O-methyltransferase involved in polyketide biosynthesis
MSSIDFAKTELAAAIGRGVRQCIVIGSLQQPWREAFPSTLERTLKMFAVDEDPQTDSPATFVPTKFASEALATALEKSAFDKRKPSFFVWLGGAGYRTAEAALASLAFIASLPRGSGVVFDYAVERASIGPLAHTPLDALASRIILAGGRVKYLIQPQAVAAMLRGLGFQQIVDLVQLGLPDRGGHLVSAMV